MAETGRVSAVCVDIYEVWTSQQCWTNYLADYSVYECVIRYDQNVPKE